MEWQTNVSSINPKSNHVHPSLEKPRCGLEVLVRDISWNHGERVEVAIRGEPQALMVGGRLVHNLAHKLLDAKIQIPDHLQLLGPPARVLQFDPSIHNFHPSEHKRTSQGP